MPAPAPPPPQNANFLNRTLWIDDNISVLRGMNSECVDLIYLDPPFNTRRIYNAPLGSAAAGAKFDDTWSMDGVKAEWAELQEQADPAMYHTIVGAGRSADESMQAYLSFMALRIQEMYRVLKPTGSLYLHCDPTASHYLKQMLDCIFGRRNFRNEIIWHYKGGALTAAKRHFPRKHDTIFFYSKTDDYFFDNPREDQLSEQMKIRWGKYMEPDRRTVRYGSIKHEKLEAERSRRRILKQEGREPIDHDVAFTAQPSLLRSVWDIPEIRNSAKYKESTGWPTQKPLKLLERIIKASSRPDDLVMDPFCGCATTMVAAERLNRQWAGVDIDEVAVGITQKRLQDEADAAVHSVDLSGLKEGLPTLHLPPSPPKRTDPDRPVRSPRIREIRWAELGTGERRPCPGCSRPKYYDDFDLDHITPLSKDGIDADENLQLLCSPCNRIKGNRLTMPELKNELTIRQHQSTR